MLLGGSYWPHYLVGLLPMLALGGGLAAAGPTRRHLRQRRLIVLAAATTLVATPAVAVAMHETRDPERLAGRWLAALGAHRRHRAGDVHRPEPAAGVRDWTRPTPILWSLPVRTVDPHLKRMRAVVRGPAAPTWIVEWDGFGSWGLDPHDQMADLVERRYRTVAVVCGEPVWLRRGVVRTLADVPDC